MRAPVAVRNPEQTKSKQIHFRCGAFVTHSRLLDAGRNLNTAGTQFTWNRYERSQTAQSPLIDLNLL